MPPNILPDEFEFASPLSPLDEPNAGAAEELPKGLPVPPADGTAAPNAPAPTLPPAENGAWPARLLLLPNPPPKAELDDPAEAGAA